MQRFSDAEVTSDVMRPYGVWAVIAPFNYPDGAVGRAGRRGAGRGEHVHHQAVGDRLVVRPPRVPGAGRCRRAARCRQHRHRRRRVGAALVNHPGVDGVTFTGSSAVGMSILQSFSTSHPKPAICEMGGKNPVIVAASADLDLAVEGTARSAFGFGGQKCSAASRVFVDESIADEFVARLVARAEAIPATRPLEPGGFLSPVVNARALERFDAAVADAG